MTLVGPIKGNFFFVCGAVVLLDMNRPWFMNVYLCFLSHWWMLGNVFPCVLARFFVIFNQTTSHHLFLFDIFQFQRVNCASCQTAYMVLLFCGSTIIHHILVRPVCALFLQNSRKTQQGIMICLSAPRKTEHAHLSRFRCVSLRCKARYVGHIALSWGWCWCENND